MAWRAERAVREGWKTSSFLCLALWPKKAKNAIEVESCWILLNPTESNPAESCRILLNPP